MQLSAEQIRRFDEDGYLFFADVFSDAEVRVLKQAATDVNALERDAVWREKSGLARTAFAAHTYHEAFRRLDSHPRPIEPLADDTLAELSA